MTTESACQISMDRQALSMALKTVIGIIEPSQVNPILGFIKLTLADGKATLTTTDNELQISTNVSAFDGNNSKIDVAIPGKKFYEICRQLPSDEPISLSFKHPWVTISQNKVSFQLQTLDTQEFPDILPMDDATLKLELEESQLKNMIHKTQFSMGHQDIRYYLNGINFQVSTNEIKATSTDGHRLSFQHSPIDIQNEEKFTIPRKAALELTKQLKNASDRKASISYHDHLLLIQTSDFSMITTTLKGQYPDCGHFQTNDYQHTALINVEPLKSSLQRASILSHDKFKAAKLQFSNQTLTITAYNQEQEKTHETLSISYTGNDTTIAFNISYIIDILNHVESEDIEMHFSESEKRVLFSEPNSKHHTSFIVMPLVI